MTFDREIVNILNFRMCPPQTISWHGSRSVTFLNKSLTFSDSIDWNFQDYGKLWNYNLQYSTFLIQDDISVPDKVNLMSSLYESLLDGRLPLEPYPVSLRCMNMIRWLCNQEDVSPFLQGGLHAELDFLSSRLEYHLLGNHLLENAFALLMGGAYFSNPLWISVSKNLLKEELTEQILTDGGHFELSPMYHQIIFYRLLESIDWYSNWSYKEEAFEMFLRSKARAMRGWLENISFKNGDVPHFNDSTNDIAYGVFWLLGYADTLSIYAGNSRLGASGYRSIIKGEYECKIDLAQLGASYQPGHSHADALSFQLYHRNSPVFIEVGTSTYENGERRKVERHTSSHNTVTIEGQNQSQLHGAFRVGSRAKTTILIDDTTQLAGSHNGYEKSFGLIHERRFVFEESCITIKDQISGATQKKATAYFHLHPSIDVKICPNSVLLKGIGHILFSNNLNLATKSFDFSVGFNLNEPSSVICVEFSGGLTTQIFFD